ncbi:lactonase family protein [Bradyrhizobium erythrophlei]|uniref:lactonase family protein n=1 Tax=Bradyrhizobium erythrophlei TaxID=1437360 RepID=UPI0035ED073F
MTGTSSIVQRGWVSHGTAGGFVFVGCFTTEQRKARGRGIDVYRAQPWSGTWTYAHHVGGLVNPSFLITDPKRRALYMVHGDSDFVSAFAIDAATGALVPLGQAATGGKNGVHLTLAPSGQFLLVANYATGSIATLPIRPDSSLEPSVHLLDLPGETGPHRTEQTFSHPHCVVPAPSGRFILVPDKGLDCVFTLAFDAADGRLEIVSRVAMRSGAGPRHLVFHPHLSFAFIVNELESSVATCRWDEKAGKLMPLHLAPALPADFFGASTAAAIVISPCGRFVYASNRGLDSIARFAFDETDGRLDTLGWTSTQGREPRFMTLDPAGQCLIVANEQGNSIVTFEIDPISGDLSQRDAALVSASPCTLAFLQA